MKQTIKIGIVGTGFARKVQIPSFLECEGTEIVSIASGHIENAESAAKEFNIPHFTADWRETVGRDDVDLICITTPPNTHHEMTLRAIDAGKHVLCEKPMAMNLAEARQMTEKAAARNVLALIDHELRFLGGRQKAFQMLRDGVIGRVRHAKCNFRNGSRGAPEIGWDWWSDKNSGGGALGAIGSHVIDSLFWFLGAEIRSIFCQLQTHVKEREDKKTGALRTVSTDDETLLIMRFADNDLCADATGIVSISMTEYAAYQNRMEFFGTEGALRIDARGEVFISKKDALSSWQAIEVDLGRAVETVPDSGFSRGFMNFAPKIVEALRTGKTAIEHAADFAAGLKVQTVLDKARESNETGCLVKM